MSSYMSLEESVMTKLILFSLVWSVPVSFYCLVHLFHRKS